MAKNFEIILNLDEPITMADGSKKQWDIEEMIEIIKKHNCTYLCAPHVPDEKSNFAHWHVGIHTSSDNTYATIAKWFGLPNNAIEGIKKRFDTTYALYIIHYNQEGKTPVSPELVRSNFNVNYDKLISNIVEKQKGDEILNDLAEGKISEYDLYKLMPVEWCRKHVKHINDALIVRSKKSAVKGEERNMEVVYITGEARTGKSYLAKKLCENAKHSYYRTSNGKNPFDDYMGQDAVILDDIRPSDFKFSELLKVLDNKMSSKVSARYHNIDINCKIMYLTTILSLEEFYKAVQESDNEAVAQLRGRINTVIILDKKTMTVKVLNDDNETYRTISNHVPNLILLDPNVHLKTDADRKEFATNMFHGLIDISQYAIDEINKDIPIGFEKVKTDEDIYF